MEKGAPHIPISPVEPIVTDDLVGEHVSERSLEEFRGELLQYELL